MNAHLYLAFLLFQCFSSLWTIVKNKKKKIFTSNQIIIFFCFQDKPDVILPDTTVSPTCQGKWLLEVCEDYVKKFVLNADEMTSLVEQTAELQQAEAGRRRCRAQGCEATYAYHSSRVR